MDTVEQRAASGNGRYGEPSATERLLVKCGCYANYCQSPDKALHKGKEVNCAVWFSLNRLVSHGTNATATWLTCPLI
jgi:hypothetical protein